MGILWAHTAAIECIVLDMVSRLPPVSAVQELQSARPW